MKLFRSMVMIGLSDEEKIIYKKEAYHVAG